MISFDSEYFQPSLADIRDAEDYLDDIEDQQSDANRIAMAAVYGLLAIAKELRRGSLS